jgi:hypothetical protein
LAALKGVRLVASLVPGSAAQRVLNLVALTENAMVGAKVVHLVARWGAE